MKTVSSALAIVAGTLLLAGSATAQPATPSPPATPPSGDVKEKQRLGTEPATPAQRATEGAKDQAGKPAKDVMKDSLKKDTMTDSMGAKDRMAAPADSERVRQVQQALKDKGQDPGPIDGVMGAQTKAALKNYQQAEGLKPTGRLDAETVARLGVSDATSPSASPRPAPGPSTSPAVGPGGETKRPGDAQTTPPAREKQKP
jgi:hypothetical protein